MADEAATVVVRVDELERETGVWCARCALPSAVRVVLAADCGPRCSVVDSLTCPGCGTDTS